MFSKFTQNDKFSDIRNIYFLQQYIGGFHLYLSELAFSNQF